MSNYLTGEEAPIDLGLRLRTMRQVDTWEEFVALPLDDDRRMLPAPAKSPERLTLEAENRDTKQRMTDERRKHAAADYEKAKAKANGLRKAKEYERCVALSILDERWQQSKKTRAEQLERRDVRTMLNDNAPLTGHLYEQNFWSNA